eukprot:PITA_19201
MSNGWTDQKGRSLINFLVNCPRGTMFMKFFDAFAYIKDARLLCDLLDVFSQEVRPQHVVQVITDNATNYVVAGKMLMERHPNLFWTLYVAHCIDLMLEDIGKILFVKDIVETSKSITKFIYNHAYVLHLMRTFTNNELVCPVITSFATSVISLQSILNSMWDVKRMFLSEEWRALLYSRKPKGEATCKLVSYKESLWAGVQEVRSITKPLVKVLRLIDEDKLVMSYLYEAMDMAKESIRSYYDDKGDEGFEKQQILWEVIDERWNNTFHRLIHATGIYLNPTFSYSCGFLFDVEVMDGFFTCFQRMVPSPAERAEFSKKWRYTGWRVAHLALTWLLWIGRLKCQMHGEEAVVAEYTISKGLPFECSTKHVGPLYRLESQRLNNMIYICYNFRLWVRQLERTPDVEALSLDRIDTLLHGELRPRGLLWSRPVIG